MTKPFDTTSKFLLELDPAMWRTRAAIDSIADVQWLEQLSDRLSDVANWDELLTKS